MNSKHSQFLRQESADYFIEIINVIHVHIDSLGLPEDDKMITMHPAYPQLEDIES